MDTILHCMFYLFRIKEVNLLYKLIMNIIGGDICVEDGFFKDM